MAPGLFATHEDPRASLLAAAFERSTGGSDSEPIRASYSLPPEVTEALASGRSTTSFGIDFMLAAEFSVYNAPSVTRKTPSLHPFN
ncbi:hypothetical protein GQX73_g10943 [Xylaria multiplex]|uniref:Uncharacterized protein n=1 Tax=Xylaria multiplex TaxID=323545 RepID=A0A7C8MHI3_9PEZI|nr:hypothetical protein GQX73_g10943 [Xylaria multiplex]